jgi:hypothetical protein
MLETITITLQIKHKFTCPQEQHMCICWLTHMGKKTVHHGSQLPYSVVDEARAI